MRYSRAPASVSGHRTRASDAVLPPAADSSADPAAADATSGSAPAAASSGTGASSGAGKRSEPAPPPDKACCSALLQLAEAIARRKEVVGDNPESAHRNPVFCPGDFPVATEAMRIAQSAKFSKETLRSILPERLHHVIADMQQLIPWIAEFHHARCLLKAVVWNYWFLLVHIMQLLFDTKLSAKAPTDYDKITSLFNFIRGGVESRRQLIEEALAAAESSGKPVRGDPAIAMLKYLFFEAIPVAMDLRAAYESGNFDFWRRMLPRTLVLLRVLGRRYAGHVIYVMALLDRIEIENPALFEVLRQNCCFFSELPI